MFKQKILKALSGLMLAAALFAGMPAMAYADSVGTVEIDGAKVRSEASTSAGQVTSCTKGTTVSVLDKTNDTSGNVWYKISLSDGTTGYMRSDLLTVTEVASETPETTEETAPADGAQGVTNTAGVDLAAIAVPEGVEPSAYQMANIIVAAGKVRSDASTNDTIVATLAEGTEVVMAGSKVGGDSKTWYYVAFVDEGTQKTGFVRADLIRAGEMLESAPVEEPDPVVEDAPVESEPAPVVNNDYELVFTDDGTGTDVWYLYDHISNTREKLQELLDFANNQENVKAKYQEQLKTYKMIIIALAVLVVIAIAIIVILLIRSRNNMYDYEDYDDEDEDDEEEEEEPVPVRRSRRRKVEEEPEEEDEEEEEAEEPQKPMLNAAQRRMAQGNAPRKPVSYDPGEEAEQIPKTERKPKPKNFILDDDDFEFEFLNMDDKR